MDERDSAIVNSPADLMRAIRRRGVRDRRVLAAFERVPRAGFVPAQSGHLAYLDLPVAIGLGQVTTQPSLMAGMIEALGLRGDERVLEVGTGHGFQTALLATVASRVISIERFAALAEQARANLASAGITNAMVLVGDGTQGVPEHAPYQAILVSAAAPAVPQPLAEQLVDGGRLVQPIGPSGDETVTLFRKQDGRLFEAGKITHAYFVPLVSSP